MIVIWDAEDAGSDVYLKAGLVTARALCVRKTRETEAQTADFEAIDRAILEIEKRAEMLGDVEKSAEAIQNHCEKIMKRVRASRRSLARQTGVLQEQTAQLKQALD